MKAIELKDWLDVFFKAWAAIVATIALARTIRKENTAKRKEAPTRKPKRKR